MGRRLALRRRERDRVRLDDMKQTREVGAGLVVVAAVAVAAAVSLLIGCGSEEARVDDQVRIDMMVAQEKWHTERLAKLRAEEGWLAIVGLHWLSEGEQRIGWSESAEVQLIEAPADAPETLALVRVAAEPDPQQVSFAIAEIAVLEPAARIEQSSAMADGQEHVTVIAAPTAATSEGQSWQAFSVEGGESPLVLRYGAFEMFSIKRGDQLALRVRNRASAARERLVEIPTFEVDPEWVIEGRFEAADGVRELAIDNSTDFDYPQRSIGRFLFERAGQQFAMELVGTDPEAPQLLMVADETSGETTYGGGRYLYVEAQESGLVRADFNRLYNPPCVFTPYATCPLPPAANRLPFAVSAGEQLPVFTQK